MQLKSQEDVTGQLNTLTIGKEECEQTQGTSPTTAEDEDYELQSHSSLRLSSREGTSKDLCNLSICSHEDVEERGPKDIAGESESSSSVGLEGHATLRPHGGTPPVIKPYDLAHVPLKQKKNAWLSLKPPTGDAHLRLSRSKSVPSEALPSTQERQVQFLAVEIREYSQTLGDNPSVSYGPPISLDWEYDSADPVPLDDFEAGRGKRRNLRQMMLNYYHRTNVLQHILGFSEKELNAAQKAAEKIKGQRAMTKATLGVSKLEEAWQSTRRKMFAKKR